MKAWTSGLIGLLCGCLLTWLVFRPHYSIVTLPDKTVLLVNHWTGATWVKSSAVWIPLQKM